MKPDPIVSTRNGAVQGSVAGDVYAFKGVPYAAPPFGPNRFRAPQPVAAWQGVRPALEIGAKPPVVPYPPPFDVLLPEDAPVGDDSLNLNIWSHDLGDTRQPVMVWIPGGQFQHGAGGVPAYDGSRFARDGVVCVTMNYRAGADGFLYTGDGAANCGLLDQIAALDWVRRNIAAFGGDPDNVTVFGQSAGAMSIASLLTMPRARGLFRRAILQSGAAHPVLPAVEAGRVCRTLAVKLGVAATRAELARVPTDRLLQAQAEMQAELMTNPDPRRWGAEVLVSHMLWMPVVDGAILPAHPLTRIAAGAGADVDVLIGTTTEEWRLFFVPNGMVDAITDDMLNGLIAAYGLPADATLAHYRDGKPDASAGEIFVALQSDWYVGMPAVQFADARATAAASRTWMYEFAWRSPQFGGRLGACHGLDIPFVFDTLVDGTEPLWGPAPPQSLADAMHSAWAGFATHGRCSWPAYDLSRRATLRFDESCTVVDDPRATTRALWMRQPTLTAVG